MGADGNDPKDDNNSKNDGADKNSYDNKVVPFPTHKIRKPKSQNDTPNADTGTGGPQNGGGLTPNRKKTLVVSLLSTMLVATFMASRVNQNRDIVRITEDQRSLASIAQSQRRDLDEDIVLARKISRQSLREPASPGREPTAQEMLSHGELASAYAIQYDKEGALRNIEFAHQSGGQPRRVSNPAEFLLKHKDLFRLEFDEVKKAESIRDNESLTEDYDLTMKGQGVAKVYFKFEKNYELHLMKVELSDESQRNPANSKAK